MPAGTDLVVWSPRVGAAGDDRYLLPSGIKINAIDPDPPAATPTLDDVNNAEGYAQVRLEIDRRLALFGSSLSLGRSGKATRQIQADVDNILYAEGSGLYPYPWTHPYSIDSGPKYKMDRTWIQEMRKALATDHVRVRQTNVFDYTSGPPWAYGISNDRTTSAKALEYEQGSLDLCVIGRESPPTRDIRGYLFFKVPLGLPALGASSFVFQWRRRNGSFATGDRVLVYRSGTYLGDLIDVADWGYLDSLLASWTASDVGSSSTTGNSIETPITTPALGEEIAYILKALNEGSTAMHPDYQFNNNGTYLKLYTA